MAGYGSDAVESYGEIVGDPLENNDAEPESSLEPSMESDVPPHKDIDDLARSHDRENVVVVMRMVMRSLLEFCMLSTNRMLAPATPQLVDLLVMLEKVLRHGFRASRALLSFRPAEYALWMMLERFGRVTEPVRESISCVEQLPTVQSVSAFWHTLARREFYEPWAVLRDEGSAEVLCGSLIGLRVIDCNLCLKQTELHRQPLSIDLSRYVKLPNVETDETKSNADETAANGFTGDLKTILDQKNYLEELNKALECKVTNLQRRVELTESLSGSGMSADAVAHNKLSELYRAMESMERSMHEKQDSIVSLSQQVTDVKKINVELYAKLRNAEQRYKNAEKQLKQVENQLEGERRTSASIISDFENKVQTLTDSLAKAESLSKTVSEELASKSEDVSSLRRDLAETNAALRLANEQASAEGARADALTLELEACEADTQQIASTRLECDSLQREIKQKDAQIKEYERTLVEMGGSLSQSKLVAEDLRESVLPLTEAQWASDKDRADCTGCNNNFTATRRRHHCRHCGHIFCAQCSGNTMALAASAKPVRVCDGCYEMLLRQRHSAKPSE